MRMDELLPEGWQPGLVPELELEPTTGNDKVVQYKGRRLVITVGRGPRRWPDFTVAAWPNILVGSRVQTVRCVGLIAKPAERQLKFLQQREAQIFYSYEVA